MDFQTVCSLFEAAEFGFQQMFHFSLNKSNSNLVRKGLVPSEAIHRFIRKMYNLISKATCLFWKKAKLGLKNIKGWATF